MELKIRKVKLEDLDRITEIETLCFPEAEAATRESFLYRIGAFENNFFVGEIDGEIIALVNGCASDEALICDELYEPEGGHNPQGKNQMIFGLATHPDFQKQGIAEKMMKYFIEVSKKAGREAMVLTCKEELIHYYEKFGYVNQGVSESVHGGAVWYDMVFKL